MDNGILPFELQEFEQLLRKPNSDPTGLASFFNAGEIWIARVPARLDVMGGIAGYSGANVCEAVQKRGSASGLYGAKITGGGTGGTVAVFGKLDALKEHIPQIATEYSRRIGVMPDIFEGTSPGALEFGARRYVFGAHGWQRREV